MLVGGVFVPGIDAPRLKATRVRDKTWGIGRLRKVWCVFERHNCSIEEMLN